MCEKYLYLLFLHLYFIDLSLAVCCYNNECKENDTHRSKNTPYNRFSSNYHRKLRRGLWDMWIWIYGLDLSFWILFLFIFLYILFFIDSIVNCMLL